MGTLGGFVPKFPAMGSGEEPAYATRSSAGTLLVELRRSDRRFTQDLGPLRIASRESLRPIPGGGHCSLSGVGGDGG